MLLFVLLISSRFEEEKRLILILLDEQYKYKVCFRQVMLGRTRTSCNSTVGDVVRGLESPSPPDHTTF